MIELAVQLQPVQIVLVAVLEVEADVDYVRALFSGEQAQCTSDALDCTRDGLAR